jgi:hypothetical protein
VWFATLTAIEALIAGQDSPLTERQRAYLQTLLFGGMGSLQDVFFDPKSLGEAAVVINKKLKEQVSELFQSVQE